MRRLTPLVPLWCAVAASVSADETPSAPAMPYASVATVLGFIGLFGVIVVVLKRNLRERNSEPDPAQSVAEDSRARPLAFTAFALLAAPLVARFVPIFPSLAICLLPVGFIVAIVTVFVALHDKASVILYGIPLLLYLAAGVIIAVAATQ